MFTLLDKFLNRIFFDEETSTIGQWMSLFVLLALAAFTGILKYVAEDVMSVWYDVAFLQWMNSYIYIWLMSLSFISLLILLSLLLMLVFHKVADAGEAIFSVILDRILTIWMYVVLLFIVLSNLSAKSWIAALLKFVDSLPAILDIMISFGLVFSTFLPVAAFFSWLTKEHHKDFPKS